MKALRLLYLLLPFTLAGEAVAHGSVGVVVGTPVPYWGPPVHRHSRPWVVAPYPWIYEPPPVVLVPAPPPPVYIEQSAPEPEAAPSWYYCRSAKAYYPYVKTCPGGWEAVPPRPER